MKKITSLQILMLMGLAVGSLNLNADSDKSQKWNKQDSCKKQNSGNHGSKVVVMNEEEHMAMEDVVNASKARIEKAMGKIPTEHSIKKFIHSVVEEFKKSNKDHDAVEAALFKLSDARIAIKKFNEKLKAVDKHGIATAHIRSLKRKLKDARKYINEHAQINAEAELKLNKKNDKSRLMDDQVVIMADDSSQGSDEVVVQATKQKKKKHKKQ
jgi:hypothetical protein